MPTKANDKKELGALWKRKAKTSGESYLSGILNFKELPGFPDVDVSVMIFSNRYKTADNHPDLRVFFRENREGAKTTSTAKSTPKAASVPAETVDSSELI